MITILDNLYVALPEMVILATACLAMLADLFLKKHNKNIALYVALPGLLFASLLSLMLFGQFKTIILGGLFISDDMSSLMNGFICITVFLCFIYSQDYFNERKMPAGDCYVLGLFSTLGMMVMVSGHTLVTLYLGLELLSLPLYAMTAISRHNSDSSEAAMKYFVMGAIASGMLLYGFSLIYGATGQLDLLDIANTIAANWQQENMLVVFALVFILVGIGFKLAAAPFHMWAPDVYQGAPTAVTLFISSAPKIAAMAMALRLLTFSLVDVLQQWQHIVLVMALLSMGIGNLVAVAQTNIKRLLSYSAIAHAGYALLGLLAGTPAGYAASLYYVLVYALMSAAAFGLICLLSRDGIEITQVSELKGLNKRNPWLAFMMLIVMFSMAGVPPTVGFFTKLFVLKSLVDVGFTWVAVLGVLFAVIGAYYYIKIIKVMYFEEPKTSKSIIIPTPSLCIYSINSLSLLYFGIFPSLLLNACFMAFMN